DGPWLLYDNDADPFQLNNLVDDPECADLRNELDAYLQRRLDEGGDEFLPGADYIRQWGYTVNESGTVPYTN
ncbi:MAG: sulfatase, partial [Gemmatimonadota bacterium]|nr:sulfatase [Gemmatimonadota bacterium]